MSEEMERLCSVCDHDHPSGEECYYTIMEHWCDGYCADWCEVQSETCGCKA